MRLPKRENAPPHPITNSSGKPEDVPDDVWDAARSALSLNFTHPIPSMAHAISIARAIMAERERCASVADEQAGREEYGHAKHAAVTIAQRIRSAA